MRSFKVLIILAFILSLVGCGSSGNGGPPTGSANLHAAGVQIVEDTRNIWGSSEEVIQPDLKNVYDSFSRDVAPNVQSVTRALGAVVSCGINPLLKGTHPDFAVGSWDADYIDGWGNVWHVHFIRGGAPVSGTDTVSFTITRSGEASLNYNGTVAYSTDIISNPSSNGTIQLTSVSLQDDTLKNTSTFRGRYDYVGGLGNIGTFSGEFDCRFNSNSNYLKFNGDWTAAWDMTSNADLSGYFETKELKISGSIKVDFVTNSHFSGGHAPSKFTIQGKIEDLTGTSVSLDGSLSAEMKNALTFEPYPTPYSATNFTHGLFNFTGTFQKGSNKTETSFTIEETSFNNYSMTYQHKLTGATNRTVTLTITQNYATSAGHIVIHSTWGPADVIIDRSASGTITGEVDVNGTKVGTITYNSGTHILRVDYTDNTFETF